MKHIVLQFLAIATFFACVGCSFPPSNNNPTDARNGRTHPRNGKADARADLAAGKLVIEDAGLPPPWSSTYERLLRERHGIEVRTVGGCIIDEETIRHMKAYNAVMKAEISRRFGKDILEKTAKEAQRLTFP